MGINHWKELCNKKGISQVKKDYLDNKEKIRRTENMLDYFDNNHTIPILKVLEPGCNFGRNLRIASDRYRECEVVGYDISEEVIIECKEYFRDKGKFEVKNLTGYDFNSYEDNYFDLGITMGFLMHMKKGIDKTRFINNFLRVCKYALMYEIYDHSDYCNYNSEYYISCEDYTKYDNNIIDTGITQKSLKLYFYDGIKPKGEN